MKILFVCTGNTCRSPMSAALANRILGTAITAESAGIDAFDGEPASPQAVTVMQRRGIDLSGHRARRLSLPMLVEANLVITMTTAQRDLVIRLGPEFKDKVFLFSELAVAEDIVNVFDPWSGSVEDYEECAAIIEEFLESMIDLFKTAE